MTQTKLKHKKEAHRKWKQGEVTWKYCRDTLCTCRGEVKKVKALLVLNLEMELKDNKRDSYKYLISKRNPRENMTSYET